MDAVVISAIAIAVAVGSMFSALNGIFSVSEAQAAGFSSVRAQAFREADGAVVPLSATSSTLLGVTDVDMTITNRGRLVYAQFDKWDVIVRYSDLLGNEVVQHVPYTEVLEEGTWTVARIDLDSGTSAAEVIDPGLLNPQEEMVIRIRLQSAVGPGTTNAVTVAPPEGGGGYIFFPG